MTSPFEFKHSGDIQDAEVLPPISAKKNTPNKNSEHEGLHLVVDNTGNKGGIGDQLGQIKDKIALKPAAEEEVPPITLLEKPRVIRGGRGSGPDKKLGPAVKKVISERDAEIALLIKQEKEAEERFDKELKEMMEARSVFVENIATLRKRLSSPSKKSDKRLHALLSQAQDHLRLLDKIFPREALDVTQTEDVFRKIVTKFKEYETARRKQTHATIKLNEGGGSVGDVNRAQAEAHALHEEVAGLTKQGEFIFGEKKPTPAQNETIKNIAEATEKNDEFPPTIYNNNDANNAMQHEMDVIAGTVEEASASAPLSVKLEVGTAILNETTPVEKISFIVEQPQEPVHIKEFDLVEKEEEVKTLEQPQATAIESFENEGGKVLGAELNNVPEEESSVAASQQAETLGSPDALPVPEVKHEIGVARPTISKEHAEEFHTKNAEVRERAIALGLKRAEDALSINIEKSKIPLGIIGKVGEAYNKFPRNFKWLIVGGLVASGAGAAFMGAATLAGTATAIGTGMRVFGGAGLFVTFEEMLKNAEEKKTGAPRSKGAEVRHLGEAASLAIVLGALLPNALHSALEGVHAPQWLQDAIIKYAPSGAGASALATAEAQAAPSAPASAPLAEVTPSTEGEYISIVKEGDNVWKMAESQLVTHFGEDFTKLPAEKQSYIIDAIKDRIERYPESYGMIAGDINDLRVGESVDFGQIFGDKEFMESAISEASNLSEAEISNIGNDSGEVSPETPPRTMSADEFLSEPKIMDFSPAETPARTMSPEEFINLGEPKVVDFSPSGTPEHIPQEITPGDPVEFAKTEAVVTQTLNDDIGKLLGESKLFGFFQTNGMDSVHWKDQSVGFSGKTVGEILQAHPAESAGSSARTFGIENQEATKKMQEYIANVSRVSGIKINSDEKIIDLIRRATVAKLSK